MADTQMIDEQEAERRELQSEFNTFITKARELYASDPVNVGLYILPPLDSYQNKVQKWVWPNCIQGNESLHCKHSLVIVLVHQVQDEREKWEIGPLLCHAVELSYDSTRHKSIVQ